MHTQIMEYTTLLLSNRAAMQAEIAAIEQDFRTGITINVTDANGVSYALVLNHPLEVNPFTRVMMQEPPKRVTGPYPIAYVYHIQSEYNTDRQERDLRIGHHRIGLSIYGSAEDPATAEVVVGRLAQATVKLLDRNQYMFSQLPRASGSSTLTYVEAEVSGQHVPMAVVPFHIVFVCHIKEVRNQ